MLKIMEILKLVLPFLIKLDGATRVVVFMVAFVGVSSYWMIGYVNAKHLEVKQTIERREVNINTKLDTNHQALVQIMKNTNSNIELIQQDVRENGRNVIQIYRDIAKIKANN